MAQNGVTNPRPIPYKANPTIIDQIESGDPKEFDLSYIAITISINAIPIDSRRGFYLQQNMVKMIVMNIEVAKLALIKFASILVI